MNAAGQYTGRTNSRRASCYACLVYATILFVSSGRLHAQAPVRYTEGFRTTDSVTVKKILSATAVNAVFLSVLVDSYYAWWQDSHRPFAFKSDDWFRIDKIGHFYTSYFLCHTFRNFMLWGGYETGTADWWGVGLSTLFGVTVELGDGLSDYGFDYQDVLYDLGGVGYAMLQTKSPWFKNINIKFSYIPRDGYRMPIRFTNHYYAHTYWVTFNLHNLLPKALRPYWPELLQPAVGYGMDGWVQAGTGSKEVRELVFGLDFNLGVFHVKNEELLLVQREIDMLHIPAPAIKWSDGRAPEYDLLYLR